MHRVGSHYDGAAVYARRPKRRATGQWSWLHATACSSAIVASGAYMHSAITEYLDAISATTTTPDDGHATPQHDHDPKAIVTVSMVLSMLPWRWLGVYALLGLWLVALVVVQRLQLHAPLRRLAVATHGFFERFRGLTSRRRSRRKGSRSARRLFSTDLDIDEDDLLVVTSLSPARLESSNAERAWSQDGQQPRRRRDTSDILARTLGNNGRGAGIITRDPEADAQILLQPLEGASGGRHQSNQIIVDDPYVSRYHFQIRYDALEKEYYLQDLGSTTGTYIFLKPDVPKRLSVDDRVKLGDTEFEVVTIDVNLTTGSPFLRICFTEGPMRGVSQTIGKSSVSLGRRSSNALCIPDDTSISGRHSVITYLGDGFYITDLHSTNGTALRLSATGVKSARRYLLHGDVFGVGANRFRVEYSQELAIQQRQSGLTSCEHTTVEPSPTVTSQRE
ncbi:hypothetical protein Poli38472_003525 [Pythium oligandrum]|uniref:FHA domain-containing protein n=1 Tax=Pythium oligandrum TaxID=41045 RepID=A0A8K1FBS9_PYTOL|nr:hypothetical protein Poli38472_003525 [Pythium oligandrum]|eukprot:TMW57600.1 hypothetical protein Poli38472_003525 [Pythium oligandrum]